MQFWCHFRKLRWKLPHENFNVLPIILKFSKFFKFLQFLNSRMAILGKWPKIMEIFFFVGIFFQVYVFYILVKFEHDVMSAHTSTKIEKKDAHGLNWRKNSILKSISKSTITFISENFKIIVITSQKYQLRRVFL